MDIRPLTPDLSVGAQIAPDDLPTLAQLGFRAIICNRPDGEAPDQPPFDQIAAAAKKEGLQARYLPIVPGDLDEDDSAAFHVALSELPGPVLAYCRSGARSTSLWTARQAGRPETAASD